MLYGNVKPKEVVYLAIKRAKSVKEQLVSLVFHALCLLDPLLLGHRGRAAVQRISSNLPFDLVHISQTDSRIPRLLEVGCVDCPARF